jgi:hypothetical protein
MISERGPGDILEIELIQLAKPRILGGATCVFFGCVSLLHVSSRELPLKG